MSDQERSLRLKRIGDEKIVAFNKAVKTTRRNPDSRAFARSYIVGVISEIVVGEDEVRINGQTRRLCIEQPPSQRVVS